MALRRGRPSPVPIWAVLACVLAASGCARRLDARTRRAWTGSGAPDSRSEDAGGGSSPKPGGETNPTPPALGWDRVSELLGASIAQMQRSPDDESLARLAQAWCRDAPQSQATEHGAVWACDLEPPVVVDGTRFTLELGGDGVIGLVAAELSAADGARVAARARRAAEHWCEAPWTDVTTTDDDPSSRKHHVEICPVGQGSVLTIARTAVDRAGKAWQVSLAIVGAS